MRPNPPHVAERNERPPCSNSSNRYSARSLASNRRRSASKAQSPSRQTHSTTTERCHLCQASSVARPQRAPPANHISGARFPAYPWWAARNRLLVRASSTRRQTVETRNAVYAAREKAPAGLQVPNNANAGVGGRRKAELQSNWSCDCTRSPGSKSQLTAKCSHHHH